VIELQELRIKVRVNECIIKAKGGSIAIIFVKARAENITSAWNIIDDDGLWLWFSAKSFPVAAWSSQLAPSLSDLRTIN
jgi:hypothetical protein